MAGCYGSSREDRHFEGVLNDYLDQWATPECSECGNDWDCDSDGEMDYDMTTCAECRREELSDEFVRLAKAFANSNIKKDIVENIHTYPDGRKGHEVKLSANNYEIRSGIIWSKYTRLSVNFWVDDLECDVKVFIRKTMPDGKDKVDVKLPDTNNQELQVILDYVNRVLRMSYTQNPTK